MWSMHEYKFDFIHSNTIIWCLGARVYHLHKNLRLALIFNLPEMELKFYFVNRLAKKPKWFLFMPTADEILTMNHSM